MLQWLLMMARVPLCWGHQAADVVARLTRAARCGLTTTDHSDGRFQLGPLSTGVQVVQAVRGRDGPAFPPFHPSVAFVHGLGIVIRHPVKKTRLHGVRRHGQRQSQGIYYDVAFCHFTFLPALYPLDPCFGSFHRPAVDGGALGLA